MAQDQNRRLANNRTKSETGFDYVTGQLELMTPFGKQEAKAARPFFPGQEEELREEFARVEEFVTFVSKNKQAVERLDEIFMCMKDLSGTVERSSRDILSEVEIFEIKSALLGEVSIRRIIAEADGDIRAEFIPQALDDLLNLLDPRHDRMNTFYLYDEYSEKLSAGRQQKRKIEAEIRRVQKKRKEEIAETSGIVLTPKFDISIPKSSDKLAKAEAIEDLERVGEDYMSVRFALRADDRVAELRKEQDECIALLEEEEAAIRRMLSRKIADHATVMLDNFRRIGRLEYMEAKARYAVKEDLTKPEIRDDFHIEFEDGRQIELAAILRRKGRDYCPISMKLEKGVTCITGANMGGKTISLKLAGLIPLMAQYGFFVPCKKASLGLADFVRILVGDSQSVERGLSSFGSEMEELKDLLDRAKDRSLILIDEIASGTNPVEGLALSKSLVDYLLKRPYISLITTHFETVTEEKGVRNLQVRGLAGADFSRLKRELMLAGRRKRIDIISKYMDYRLTLVENEREVPKDALHIAAMLGIDDEIIDGARKYIH